VTQQTMIVAREFSNKAIYHLVQTTISSSKKIR
jgi:hypothetical protein